MKTEARKAYENAWKRRKIASETPEERVARRARNRVVFNAWHERTKDSRREKIKKWRSSPEVKGKAKERTREWEKRNPRRWRNGLLLRKYGITLEQYEAMLLAQDGVCAVCKKDRKSKGRELLPVDHDHATGKIRGILCQWCNRAIGLLNDDPQVLQEAARYLLKNGSLPQTWRSIVELG